MSDSYMKASTRNGVRIGSNDLSLRFAYVDYATENQNDAFSFALSDTYSPNTSTWRYTGVLLGNVYTSSSPGTTDNSFTNYGIDLNANRNMNATPKHELEIGGGYRLRIFPSLDGRNDHSIYGATSIDFDLNERLHTSAYGELGFIVSNVSDYSRIYMDLGGTVEYEFSPQWIWVNDASISRSAFTSRTVSTTTLVDQRRGNRVVGTLSERETYGSFNLSTEISRLETTSLKWGAGLYVSRHSSKSGFQDYSVLQALVHLSLKF